MSDTPKPRRRFPRPATVLAGIAVFVALGGTATAAKQLINGNQIKPGTITAKQVKNKSLSLNKLNNGAVKQLSGETGPRGPAGPRGEEGQKGTTGERGPAGVVAPLFGELSSINIAEGAEEELIELAVSSAGSFVINAKTNVISVQNDGQVECRLESGGDDVDVSQWTASAMNERNTLALQAVASATPADPIRLFCSFSDSNGSAFDAKLTAIPVS